MWHNLLCRCLFLVLKGFSRPRESARDFAYTFFVSASLPCPIPKPSSYNDSQLDKNINCMSFGSVFAGIVVVYAVYYAGNILYDLRFRKSKEDNVKTEEEEVDIDEIAGEVIQTQEVNKHSLSDYMPSLDDEDREAEIMCNAAYKVEEVCQMFDRNPDHPDNPLGRSKIAFWVKDEGM